MIFKFIHGMVEHIGILGVTALLLVVPIVALIDALT